MLLEDFYKIKNKFVNEGGYQVEVLLNVFHPIYDGHFPDMPVVPGVCSLQLIKEIVSEAKGMELRYEDISGCKFLQAINPREDNVLYLSFSLKDLSENKYALQALVRSNEKDVLKIKAVLRNLL